MLFKKTIKKGKYIYSTVFIEKNPHVSRLLEFKSVIQGLTVLSVLTFFCSGEVGRHFCKTRSHPRPAYVFYFYFGEDMKLKRPGPVSWMEEKKSIFDLENVKKKILFCHSWGYFYFSYRGRVEWDVMESATVDHWSVQGPSAPIYMFLRARGNEWPMHSAHF